MRAFIRNKTANLNFAFSLLIITALFAAPLFGQNGAQDGDWQYWGGDAGSIQDIHGCGIVNEECYGWISSAEDRLECKGGCHGNY